MLCNSVPYVYAFHRQEKHVFRTNTSLFRTMHTVTCHVIKRFSSDESFDIHRIFENDLLRVCHDIKTHLKLVSGILFLSIY